METIKEDQNVAALFGGIHWHQRWEIFPGIWTPGRNPVAQLCERIGLPRDLSGLRVLDVGAWNGCFSFECERRGAAEVVALSLEDPETSGFNRLGSLLKSRVRYVRQSVYTLDRRALGEFDLILFLGVLYHLRYPLLALDKLRTVCRGRVLTETHVIDHHVAVPGWFGEKVKTLRQISPAFAAMPLWRFYPGKELNGDPSNWFGPNIPAVLTAFASAGFEARLFQWWDDRASFEATASGPLSHALADAYESWGDNPQVIGFE